jgi:hypothetical protein
VNRPSRADGAGGIVSLLAIIAVLCMQGVPLNRQAAALPHHRFQ